MREELANRALECVQEATLRPEFWPAALLAIAEACRSSTAMVQMVGANGYESRVSEDIFFSDFIEGGWHVNNPRMERGLLLTQSGHQGLITEWHSFTPQELARQAFQQDFAVPHGIDCEAGMVVAAHGGASFILTMQRPGRIGRYEGRELLEMNRLVKGIAEACAFALKLKLAAAVDVLHAFDDRCDGLALLSTNGRILHATDAFEAYLHGPLTVSCGRLRAREPACDQTLQAQIAKAAAGSSIVDPIRPVIMRANEGLTVVRLLPVVASARDILGLASVIVMVDDLERPRPASVEGTLVHVFGLTSAEARLALKIGSGTTIRDAAAEEGVTLETARSRLKAVFQKTNTHRQAQLAILVDRLGR